MFASAPLQIVGKRSFCIYLVHIPVWIAVAAVLHRAHVEAQPGSAAALGAAGLTFVATVAVAALSWRFFEEPILLYKRRFEYAMPRQLSAARA